MHAVNNKSDNTFGTAMKPRSCVPDHHLIYSTTSVSEVYGYQRTLLSHSPVRQRINALPQQPPDTESHDVKRNALVTNRRRVIAR